MKRKLLPYLLPIGVTLVFIATAHAGLFCIGPVLIPFISFFHRWVGRFTPEEVVAEFSFFETRTAKGFLLFNGVFFVAFQFWIAWFLTTHPLAIWQQVLFLYSVVVLNANFATSLTHELMHIRSAAGKILSNALLLINGFFYLRADHLFIHHAHVGTALDPASAPLGIGLWQYFRTSILGRMRILFSTKDDKSHQIPSIFRWLTYGNLIILIFTLMICFLFAKPIFWWLLAQFIFVPFLYEIVTYVQHYGLGRNSQNGIERIAPNHSWNCFYKLSAYMHFMMPVHSLHHVYSDEAKIENIGPSMPKPFQDMVLLALWPSKWRKLMDSEVSKTLNSEI